jgi:hypothetical protein
MIRHDIDPLPRLLAALALLLALTGCAAAAIPVLAGGMIARQQARDEGDGPRLQPSARPEVYLPAESAPPRMRAPDEEAESAVTPAPRPTAASPELPPVSQPAAAEPTAATTLAAEPTDAPVGRFSAYTVTEANRLLGPGAARQSVLIDPDSLIAGPKPLPCKTQPLAVAIDLDPGSGLFDLNDPPAPAPGLAEALAQIRAAGVTIFWTSALPVSDANRLYTVLRAVGLDLDGTDRVLLGRKRSETKQQRRLAAARDWCFVALAGDRLGDFEEAIDYLRDPDGPTMRAMDPLRGSGWFVTPNPIN